MHRQEELSLNPAQIRSALVYKLKDISLTILKGKNLVVIVKSATRSEIGTQGHIGKVYHSRDVE